MKISAIALLKMVMHARSGGDIEVMGIMIGKISGDSMVILDAFALPVQGTETRVNAGAEANEYMISYLTSMGAVGRQENAIGWYHSHPGYGCWLSGIDVATQNLQQTYQDPWVAVVVDPTRTASAGKVEIGAFRTWPKGYKPVEEATGRGYQSIPLAKIEDFGTHKDEFYQLETSFFRSSLDSKMLELLWHRYWVSTLSSSPLVSNVAYNAGQLHDVAEKIEQAETQVSRGGGGGSWHGGAKAKEGKEKEDTPLARAARDASKTSVEQLTGLISLVAKDVLFNTPAAL